MGLLSANNLGVYIFKSHDYSSTSPYKIFDGSTFINAYNAAAADTTASLNDVVMFVNGDTALESGALGHPAVFRYTNIQANPASTPHTLTDAQSLLNLAYAATNSTLDLSNATDEVVAKTTQCNSTTYTSIGAQSWSITCDGLISADDRDAANADAYGTDIFDICNYGYYCIVKYVMDIENDDVPGTDDKHITYIGQGIVESANITGTFDSTSTYSATIRGYGKLYKFNN